MGPPDGRRQWRWQTTTLGKLAYQFQAAGETSLLVAADTFRAAAIEQAELWAKRAGVDIIKGQPGGDAAAVAFDAVRAARARQVERVLIDTAGRLHTKVHLMEELKKCVGCSSAKCRGHHTISG